jgi:predicted nucleic acid-binding protein
MPWLSNLSWMRTLYWQLSWVDAPVRYSFLGYFSFVRQAALFEVAKYIPAVAKHAELPEIHIYREFQLLPIEACQPTVYEQFQDAAEALIGYRDPRDVPVLSLAMARRLPIWSNDKDFEGLAGVQVLKTSELISRLTE